MPHGPKVSVVIPALNEEKYLPHCLSSFAKQTYTNFELIVSDGGSTDKTAEIARAFGAHIVVTTNSTVTLARQKGVKASKGEIIVGSDADTRYPKDHLKRIIERFEDNQKIVAVGGGGIFEPKPKLLRMTWHIFYAFVAILFRLTGYVLYMPAFNLSFRKSAFNTVGGYTTYIDYGGDEMDFLNKLKKIGDIYFDKDLKAYPSSRRAKEGFFKLIVKHTLIDYYGSMWLAKIFKRTVIRGKPVR